MKPRHPAKTHAAGPPEITLGRLFRHWIPFGKTLVSDIPVPELRNLMRH